MKGPATDDRWKWGEPNRTYREGKWNGCRTHFSVKVAYLVSTSCVSYPQKRSSSLMDVLFSTVTLGHAIRWTLLNCDTNFRHLPPGVSVYVGAVSSAECSLKVPYANLNENEMWFIKFSVKCSYKIFPECVKWFCRSVVFNLGYAKTSYGVRKIKKYIYYFMINTE